MCASEKGNVKGGGLVKKVLKVLGWTLLGVVVVLGALLLCVAKFLDSKDFAPFVERTANDYIDGHLKLGRLKLGFHPKFPILGLEADNLTLISHAFDSLTVEQRGLLPNYADSLLSLDHLSASIDIKRLIVNNEIALHNVALRGLSINLVIAHNGKANYEVMKTQTDSTDSSTKRKMPGFRIDRFALDNPKEMRFYNASDSTSASVLLLTDAAVEGDKAPTYRLKINGNVTSPKATILTNLNQINFGLNGKVYWDPTSPGLVAMEEMELQGAFIKAIITGEVDFQANPIVKKAIVDLPPVALTDLLTLLPDSIRRVHRLYEPYFATDLTIGGRIEFTKPMDLTTDTVPTAQLKLSIPPSKLRYDKAQFEDIALDVIAKTLTNLPDSTVVNISRFTVAGPATDLKATALISTLFSDPTFDTNVQGQLNLANLPPIIREKIPGYLSGIILTDLHANGKGSHLKQEHLHRLVADGSVTAQDVYFLSADTTKMVELSKARINFDSKRIIGDAPVLSTKLDIDTANILIGGVDIAFSSLALDAGVEDADKSMDTTMLFPIGGNLKVNRLNIISITDSAGGRIRNLDGHVTMNRAKGKSFLLEFLAVLNPGRVSAGSLSDRILLDDVKINATLRKLPSEPKKQAAKSKVASDHKEYPYISPVKVFKYVYNKRHHKPGQKRTKRVYGTLGAGNQEVLEWNLAKGFSKFLNEWQLKGTVTTNNARLLTPIFPMHNRFTHLDVKFNNDTVNITDIDLRTGHSDITLSGMVTNVRRALTSKTNNTLKVNLSLLSDTIDINQLSAGIFTGASYAENRRQGKIHLKGSDSDADLQASLDELAKKGPGKTSPVLIPVNVEANLKIEANNVLYSDLNLQNMGGDLLVYDGGVNLHKMQAHSDAGNLIVSALYSAPKPENMHFGFGMELEDFNIGKFVKLVPAVDSIMPLIHDFSGMVSADIAATCDIDAGMNLDLPTLNAAIRITGDNLAFINPETYRTIGKWLGFKDKADNTIKRMNVEMTVDNGIMRVYPFVFNIDRYRLGISGSNDIAMNFDYHISVLKSPLPFKFGINISGRPHKYKVRFGGAKFKEDTAIESVSVVNNARINLVDQIENVFKRGVQNSRFAKLQVARPADYKDFTDPGLSAADSLQLIQEGLIDGNLLNEGVINAPQSPLPSPSPKSKTSKSKSKDKTKEQAASKDNTKDKSKSKDNKDNKNKSKNQDSNDKSKSNKKDDADQPKKKRKKFLFF